MRTLKREGNMVGTLDLLKSLVTNNHFSHFAFCFSLENNVMKGDSDSSDSQRVP